MIDVCAGIILNEKNEILITQRILEDNTDGGWEFPGGKLEEDENPSDALVRELKEELNILVHVDKHCLDTIYHYPQKTIKLMAFYCHILAGDIHLSVHQDMKWVRKEELLSYPLLPADIPIANKILEEL